MTEKKKQNIKISRCEGLEVYCVRDHFNYQCKNTPNNCTECPVMRFLYHDLTTRVLAEQPAADLMKLVEDSQAFGGKFDGNTVGLPAEVWTAIHAIRNAYNECSHPFTRKADSDEEGYASADEHVARFNQWYARNGVFNGKSVTEITKDLAEQIKDGCWVAVDDNGNPMMYADSGIYNPAVFADSADGAEFLRRKISQELHIDIFENAGCPARAQTSTIDPNTIKVSLSANNSAFLVYMKYDSYKKLTERIKEKFYIMKKVDAENASSYQEFYKASVKNALEQDIQ